jgi:two-component system sensor histidine kinase/response regulator
LQHGRADAPVELHIDGSDNHAIRISVRNQGVISPEQLQTIFEPFHLGAVNRRSAQGLGLGLYIVKQFVEAHGGQVQVFSDEAEGTSFDLTMPRNGIIGPAEDGPIPAVASAPASHSEAGLG